MRVVNIKKLLNKGIGKYYTNFRKYSIIGVVFTLCEVVLFWIFVDSLGKNTLISIILIIGSTTILKFYSYVYSGMMEKKIFGYMLVFGVFYGVNVALVWFFVEVLEFLASVSSGFLAVAFFILRFFAYDKFKLLKS